MGLDTDDAFRVRWVEVPYPALAVATVPTWLVILALADAYDIGPFGSTTRMWTRAVRAGAQLLAVVAVSYYVLHLALVGRGVLAATVPLAVGLDARRPGRRRPGGRPPPPPGPGSPHRPGGRVAGRRRRAGAGARRPGPRPGSCRSPPRCSTAGPRWTATGPGPPPVIAALARSRPPRSSPGACPGGSCATWPGAWRARASSCSDPRAGRDRRAAVAHPAHGRAAARLPRPLSAAPGRAQPGEERRRFVSNTATAWRSGTSSRRCWRWASATAFAAPDLGGPARRRATSASSSSTRWTP